MIVIIAVIFIIKFTFGAIELNNIFGYPGSKARFFEVTLNNTKISVDYNLKHRVPIVPFLIIFNSYYIGNNFVSNDGDGTYFYADDSDKYLIKHTVVILVGIKLNVKMISK